jgi:hypothetical protein
MVIYYTYKYIIILNIPLSKKDINKMSKWFASARDFSDSESSDSSDEEKPQQQTTTTTTTAAAGAKKPGAAAQVRRNYMKGFEDSSESEEEQRVVKTTQDKKREVLDAILADLRNHLKINDFGSIMQDFEKLSEEVDKSANHGGVIFEKGKDQVLPNYIVRAFVKIEDAIAET